MGVAEETSQLRAGVTRAELAADEIIESATLSGRQVDNFMEAARGRVTQTRARYGFTEASDNVFGMADDAAKKRIQANKIAGDDIRDIIAAREAPALPEQTFHTVGGTRRVDVLKLGDAGNRIQGRTNRTWRQMVTRAARAGP